MPNGYDPSHSVSILAGRHDGCVGRMSRRKVTYAPSGVPASDLRVRSAERQRSSRRPGPRRGAGGSPGRGGATVLFAWCERIGPGPDFALHVEPAPPGIADTDPVAAVTVLNQAVERIARRDPAQYQWTYKRYTLRPEGSGEDNPYS